MRKFIIIFLLVLITACKTTGSYNSQSIGNFVFAGPMTSNKDGVKTVNWTYGIEFSINLETITQISLTCTPIPDTTFIVTSADFKPVSKGAVFFDGKKLSLTKEDTPWIFDPETKEV